MGKTFHRKHYDKFNYGNDDYDGFKKRRKKNDRRTFRHTRIADKHENINVGAPEWTPDNKEMTT